MNAKIVIGIPCLDTIKTETFISLFSAAAKLRAEAILHVQKSCYVHDARNKIISTALQRGSTHVMFIDSDMKFPPDGINRLLDQDKDVIGGVYFRRQVPHLPTINDLKDGKIVVPYKFPKDKSFRIWSVATGFMLVKTEILKKIKYPWVGFGNYKGQSMGDDVYFCRKINDHGGEVWADPTIPLGHVGEYVYDMKDYQAYQDTLDKKDSPDEFNGEMK